MSKDDRARRSAEERERARIERELRRAAREGRPPDERLTSELDAIAPPVQPHPRVQPTETETPRDQPPAQAAPQPEPTRVAPPADDWLTPDPEPPVKVIPRPGEQALGTKRVSASTMASSAGAEAMPRFGAPPKGKGPRRARSARRFGPLVLVLVLLGAFVFAVKLVQPFHGEGNGRVVVQIPAGSSADDIGRILADGGVVSSKFFFSLRARISGDRGKLRAGTFTLKKDMSYAAALERLTTAPKTAPTVTVTVPEGLSIRETIPRVREAGLRGGYLKAAKDRSLLDPRDYGAPKRVKTLEGFLFPSTYELKAGAPAAALVASQVKTFKREFATVDLSYAKRKNLTVFDVITIASMIEREAAVPKDRALISAVIYNRLKADIPLGIDATIRYELDNWTRPLKVSELNRDTPYNTRRRLGLPPTPIGSPGIASIKAAAKPAKVKYLYYVVKPCGKGAHKFSSTDAEFQRDVAAYNAARAKNGGNDPSDC